MASSEVALADDIFSVAITDDDLSVPFILAPTNSNQIIYRKRFSRH